MTTTAVVGEARRIRRRYRLRARTISIVVILMTGISAPTPAFAAQKAWKLVPSPSVGSDLTQLAGVTCVDRSHCFAVGIDATGSGGQGPAQTLVESWDGSSWAIVPSPTPGIGGGLTAVSCVAADDCFAVGSYSPASGFSNTLVEHWDGTSWSLLSTPNKGTQSSDLLGVSCSGPSRCVAVGAWRNVGVSDPGALLLMWDGTTWRLSPDPDALSPTDLLRGVSCSAPSSCFAVGSAQTGIRKTSTLVEGWNGSTWSVVKSPNDRSTTGLSNSNDLSGVSCPTPTSCTAVGDFYDGAKFVTLIEVWDGTAWSIKRSPNAASTESGLASVSCATTTNCAAVGFYQNASGGDSTLVEVWHGTRWVTAASANPGNYENIPTSVTCPTTRYCDAVGYYGDSGSLAKTLVLSP